MFYFYNVVCVFCLCLLHVSCYVKLNTYSVINVFQKNISHSSNVFSCLIMLGGLATLSVMVLPYLTAGLLQVSDSKEEPERSKPDNY